MACGPDVATLPLDGVRVVAFAETAPGPLAAGVLADLGAEVIVVERPTVGDPARATPAVFLALGRNKRFIAIDLKRPEGMEVAYRLIASCDVVINAYRPQVSERLGLSVELLARRFPDQIVAGVSGYGEDGPAASKAAHDLSLQASSGLLGAHVDVDAVPVVDMFTGLYCAVGVLAALVGRTSGNRAGSVLTSMQDCAYALNMFELTRAINLMPADAGLRAPAGYGVFATRDGRRLALSVSFESAHWRALCEVLGLGTLSGLSLGERVADRDDLTARVAEVIQGSAASELDRALLRAGIPFEWVLDAAEVVQPWKGVEGSVGRARGDGLAREHLRSPLLVDGGTLPIRREPGGVGADADAILSDLGCTVDDVRRLRRDGVLGA
jgi:crotonobetainyl-CoA:carnitine CoA-transferase CaiB-like acyl-CoA transferase